MFAKLVSNLLMLVLCVSCIASIGVAQDQTPTEVQVAGPGGLPIVVRMQGPYDAEVDLQIVCYFKRTATSDAKLFGAPVELDKRLGGLIASLRERGEFKGEEYETLLIKTPAGTIQPKHLLLIGLGNEADLSLQRMESVGRTAVREAARIGAKQVAFAPLIKDAGNDKLPAGDVENAVVFGMLLAHDTEQRLQKQGFAPEFQLEQWIIEAGPTYFAETVTGVKKGVDQAQQVISQRPTTAYSSKSN